MTFPNYSLPNFNKEIITTNNPSNLYSLINSKANANNNTARTKSDRMINESVNIIYCFN